MERLQQVLRTANTIAESEEFDSFMMNTQDFLSSRSEDGTSTTKITQAISSLENAAEILNRSLSKGGTTEDGVRQAPVNIISPVVIPKGHRSWGWVFVVVVVLIAAASFGTVLSTFAENAYFIIFGPHFWIFFLGYILFQLWRNSFVMIPDGCMALITKFGRVEEMVDAGRHYIFHPWKRVGYIVNVTKEYPYNAPIREAPTSGQVNASVDLFLQFRIKDPRAFIFTLGGVNGFSEKLQNAISEQTRALIYAQRAEDIYDLIGEATTDLLASLNAQFDPAVEFVNANITHAEPSSQEYRMDLAAAEMVRVAKEAYTYKYELDLRKKRDEGDLDKELAGLRETLSGIEADVATYEAQISTAREKEINRANAYASQLMIEAESAAKANAALYQAQALDIRAVKSAYFPEILEYRYQQQVLDRIANASDRLPQIIKMGDDKEETIDFMEIAQQMLGVEDKQLYSEEDLAQIRTRLKEITERIRKRQQTIQQVVTTEREMEAVKAQQEGN
ncbi:MAG: SPFH domain-containing protein [Chloroflexota bacterium]